MEQRLVSPDNTEEDTIIAKPLRPKTFGEFIGQQDIVTRLFIAAKAAAERKEPIDHMIFIGEPGLGKTTLARLVGGNSIQEASAAMTSDTSLKNIFANMLFSQDIPTFFLDELHSLKRQVAEVLYPVMEDGVLQSSFTSGGIYLPKFTFIGATTHFGKVAPPMRSRFTHIFKLKPYTHLELSKILVISREKLNIDASDEAIVNIARRARGTPRIANRFLKIARDYASLLDENIINKVFLDIGIDKHGLDETDREYLTVLKNYNRATGVATLSSLLGTSEEDITEVIEPWLLKQGYAVKTPRGRVIDPKGVMMLAEK